MILITTIITFYSLNTFAFISIILLSARYGQRNTTLKSYTSAPYKTLSTATTATSIFIHFEVQELYRYGESCISLKKTNITKTCWHDLTCLKKSLRSQSLRQKLFSGVLIICGFLSPHQAQNCTIKCPVSDSFLVIFRYNPQTRFFQSKMLLQTQFLKISIISN